MGDPLWQIQVKIDRAKKHLGELSTEISAYHGRTPYRIVPDKETQAGHELYRFYFNEPIPKAWGGLVGDIVHNLRTALDSLATTLVLANGETREAVIRKTYFPIGASKQVFDGKLPKDLKGASQIARDMVKRLKPYKGGTDAFWRLHQLDIVDKHTSLIPMGASHTQLLADFSSVFTEAFKDFGVDEAFKFAPVAFNPAQKFFPLKDGDIIHSYGFGTDPDGKFKPKFNFTLDIAFGEGQVIDGETVVPSLQQLVDFVERIIGIFRRKFFKLPL